MTTELSEGKYPVFIQSKEPFDYPPDKMEDYII